MVAGCPLFGLATTREKAHVKSSKSVDYLLDNLCTIILS